MTTRTIVTSQPDVACDVCERRLLRGEHADVFVATDRRRLVCELCTPRAVHEGWLRESEQQELSLPPMRPRRGRSLLDRLHVPSGLRQMARRGGERRPADSPDRLRDESQLSRQPYDFGHAEEAPAQPGPGGGEAGEPIAAPEPPSTLDLALEAFNTSEYPRRVAGVARSLGAPEVNVRPAEHAGSVIRIHVAWELCWYRYEVDLDEPEEGARVAAQGTELGELEHEDRVVNAVADDSGALSLVGT